MPSFLILVSLNYLNEKNSMFLLLDTLIPPQ
jgi:hypothetical protein